MTVRRLVVSLIVFVSAVAGSGACVAQTATLSLTTGALPPLSAAAGQPGFLDVLARAVFKRVGVEAQTSVVPVERSMINVNDGRDDGDIFRAAGIELQYPNLIRVPGKILDNDFVAYTKRADVRIERWADLQGYAVAYATGWKIFDLNVKGARELTKVASIQDLFPLLENGRADVVLMDRWQGQWIVRQHGYQVRLIEPPLARVEMFIYLNKKHAALVPRVAQALVEMKADGSYQKIHDTYLKPWDGR